MNMSPEHVKLLGLTHKEIAVIDALFSGKGAILAISKTTGISRPAIHEILIRLKKRGIAKKGIKNGKTHWSASDKKDLEAELYATKKQLLRIGDEAETVFSASDSIVVIHRGGPAIRTVLESIFKDNKEQKVYGIQGDVVNIGWNKVFGVEGTNEINRLIKKNKIIVEGIVPIGWFERQLKLFGTKWAEDFAGRAAITHEMSEDYFKHGGQIFMFKNALYLIAMNEEVVIEVRNSEIQKMILSLFQFLQDNSRKIDVNSILRGLMGES